MQFDGLIDTGAEYLVLPRAWQNRLGQLDSIRHDTLQLGDQSRKFGEMCGPVKIQLKGFLPFYGEVLFVDMAWSI